MALFPTVYIFLWHSLSLCDIIYHISDKYIVDGSIKRMRYERENDRVCMSVTELASFALRRENPSVLCERFGFKKEVFAAERFVDNENRTADPRASGVSLHNAEETKRLSDAYSLSPSVMTEYPLEKIITYGEYTLSVSGYADIISYFGHVHTIEEVKTTSYFSDGLNPFSNPSHFAQAVIYAFLFCESEELGEVDVRLSYIKSSNGDKMTFTARFQRVRLARLFDTLITRAYPVITAFSERVRILPGELKAMPFPYSSIRETQNTLIQAVYSAIRHSENLLVSAPTGTGKTISVLFPALKCVSGRSVDRIFYLTAKNVTGKAALAALARITKYAEHLRSVMICAKEVICPYMSAKKHAKEDDDASDVTGCRYCEKLDSISNDFGKTYKSYRERELEALEELILSTDHVYTVERIVKTAEKHSVCPYELSLDLSESCTVIVCDYNYVIDDGVRFRRYFREPERREKYVFLFDEAHNLPDRTRSAYSSFVDNRLPEQLLALAEGELSSDTEYTSRTEEFTNAVKQVYELCTENETFRTTDKGDIAYGYYEAGRIPDNYVRCAGNLAKVVSRIIRETPELSGTMKTLLRELNKIVFAAAYFDDGFRFFASRENEKLKAEILCIDPSGILEAMLGEAVSVILFSATLSPDEYYRDMTGLIDAEFLDLPSPYDKNNLCLIAYDSISTRLNDRKDTAFQCAEVIAEAIMAKKGNYIVYFPSYDYMNRVYRMFGGMLNGYGVIVQKQNMGRKERERFLSLFSNRSMGPLVGFCVLGGMFSEGIDLVGDSLIGAVIIGTGMPQLSAERNIMASYFAEKYDRGYEYSYLCPGMNKILQAAGRVIRTENDRGIVLFIDDRFGDANVKSLFPPHYRHIKYTGDIESMNAIIDKFWNG